MNRNWAIVVIALLIAIAVAMNFALAVHAAQAPAIPLDHVAGAFD